VRALLAEADRVLRVHEVAETIAWRSLLLRCLAFVFVGGALFGAVMGTFGGLGSDRSWQVFYSATKVPLLLIATVCVSLPSFFVLNTLLGLRSDFGQVLRALLETQAVLALILASLSPYVAVWYASFTDYGTAVLFNAVLLGLASVAAQVALRTHYRALINRSRKHRILLQVWIVTYAFVGIQMAWVLRPFVGSPGEPVQFFRSESWGNAYAVVARLIWRVLSP